MGPAVLRTSNEGKNVEITLVTRETDGYSVVEVSGEVDVYTAPQLDEQLSGLVEAGSYQLVVDLSAVEFLDSTGLGVLVKALKRVREHGNLLVEWVSPGSAAWPADPGAPVGMSPGVAAGVGRARRPVRPRRDLVRVC